MRKILTLLLIIVALGVNAQTMELTTDSIEVYDGMNEIKRLPAKTNFYYLNQQIFNLDCSDTRVYSFLLPNTQFTDRSVISFQDTGYMFTMSDTVTVNVGDTTNTENLGVLYQSLNTPNQVIQVADSSGIKLIKRDKTYIKFF